MSETETHWPQLTFRATRPFDAELIETALESCGALAITMTDAKDVPIYEPAPGETPLWQETCVTGLFAPESDWSEILPQLQIALPAAWIEAAEKQAIPDQDWVRAWMDQFKPMKFGTHTWIVPSHCAPPEAAATNILLDPGLAFGTGTHPTTAMCLTWIDQHHERLAGQPVLDYGTGSGVLAIAALAHGAVHVDAVDIDPQALTATLDNAEKNAQTAIKTYLPEDFSAHSAQHEKPYPVVLANILAQPLIELADYLANLTQTGGSIVLAGLTEAQREIVWAAYQPYFETPNFAQQEQWVCISATRKAT